MLKTLFRTLVREPAPFDPAVFEDELAMKTSWDPVVYSGASFGTHNLKLVSPERMVFSASMAARLFIGIFFAVGVGAIFFLPLLEDGWVPFLEMFFFVAAFLGFAIFFGSRMCELHSFDRRENCFWKGRWKRRGGVSSVRRADGRPQYPLNAQPEKRRKRATSI